MEIREATIEDFDEIFRLFTQLQPDTTPPNAKVKNFFEEMLSTGKHKAYVAIDDSKIVGYMDVVFHTYHFSYEFTARIETTIVDKNYRRKGIASSLTKKCEQVAKEMGCERIEVDSATHRTEAHELYEKNGFTKRGYLFWKKLE